MENVIYERVYNEKCKDMDDINFLSRLPYNTDWFEGVAQSEKIRFSRLGTVCIMLAESTRGKLTVYRCDGGARFFIDTQHICLDEENVKTFMRLSEHSMAQITVNGNNVRIVAEYFLKKD